MGININGQTDVISATDGGLDINGLTTLNATSIVGVTTAGITTAYIGAINDGPISGTRNRIINGSMDIFQRGTATTIGASSVYALDRWLFGREAGTESARFTVTQQALATSDSPFTVGITTTMKIDVTTASGGISAGQSHYLMQRIEGYNVSDFAYGTSSAKPCTLSFWLKTDVKTGTMAVSLYNSGNRHYVQSISATTSWTKYSLTFPGDASGSLPNDNTSALQVMFVLSAGSNLQSTANAWTAGFKNSLSGQADFTDSTSNNIYITGFQLEEGKIATPFEHRSFGQELALCQRYYYRVKSNNDHTIGVGYNQNTSATRHMIFFPVTMRVQPSTLEQSGTAADYSIYHGTSLTVCTSVPIFTNCTTHCAEVQAAASGSLTAGQGSLLSMESTGFLGWSAEL